MVEYVLATTSGVFCISLSILNYLTFNFTNLYIKNQMCGCLCVCVCSTTDFISKPRSVLVKIEIKYIL